MRANGYSTAAELSRACGVDQGSIGKMLLLQVAAFNKYGKPLKTVSKVAKHLSVLPEDIFPVAHRNESLKESSFEAQVTREQMALLTSEVNNSPENVLEFFDRQTRDVFGDMLSSCDELKEREAQVLNLRMVESKTYDQCGEVLGVSKERVRQIERKALRRLRHPDIKEGIIEAAGSYADYMEA